MDIWVEDFPANFPPVGEFAWAFPHSLTGGRVLSDSGIRHSGVSNGGSLGAERIVFVHKWVPPEYWWLSSAWNYIAKLLLEPNRLGRDGKRNFLFLGPTTVCLFLQKAHWSGKCGLGGGSYCVSMSSFRGSVGGRTIVATHRRLWLHTRYLWVLHPWLPWNIGGQ